MKNKSFALLTGLLFSLWGFAQKTQLQITVKDNGSASIQNATVALIHLPDSLLVSTKTSREKLSFDVNTNANYLVKITAIGFIKEEQLINVGDTAISITITLKNKTNNLGNVTVVSRKPLIKQEDDKTIVDAAALANSSTNAYEVLEKTPGTVVDQDGNVYLSSTSPATVFINGREIKLSSTDLASLLKSLPAGSVSKIEILRNPSAKYDAASSGGIVNIVLKKGVKLGTNGSINAAYFQGVYSTKTAGVNLNTSAGKLTSYLSYQYTDRNNFEELNSQRFIVTDSSLLAQESYTTYPSTTNYIGSGVDIALTKKLTIGYDLRLTGTNSKSNAVNNSNITNKVTQALLAKNESAIYNKNKSIFWGNNISAKYKIDTLGSEWVTEFDYTYYKNSNTQLYTNHYYYPLKPDVNGDGDIDNNKNIFVAQTDLTLKLPQKYTLEAGFKSSISKSNNVSAYFRDTGNNTRFVDIYQTNTFEYNETITAAYLQASKTFAGFTIKPGLRLETTNINGRQFIPKDTSFSIKRTDLFPYLFLKHKLFKMFGFPLIGNVIYRKSIKRPYYETLNPYPKYVDQYLFDIGNPRLKPQLTTNYELNVTFDDFPVFAFGINETKDIFSNVTYQDNATKIAFRTYDNLGKNKELYFKLIGGIPPGGKYFFYVGAQYNYNQYEGFYQNQPLNYSRGSYTFFMYHEFKASSKLTFNMQGFMRTKGLQNFYELNTFGGLYVSVNKSILKKKANIILSVNDLLQTNHVAFTLNQADVNAAGTRVNDTRKLGLTLRYNFGIKPKEENKKSFDAPSDNN